eukprot:g3762.t1
MPLSQSAFKQTEIMKELLKTEETYVRDLGIAIQFIMNSLLESKGKSGLFRKGILTDVEIKKIFGNIKDVHSAGKRFLKALREATAPLLQAKAPSDSMVNDVTKSVSDTVARFCEADFSVYAIYLHNYEKHALSTLKALRKRRKFQTFLTTAKNMKECRRLSLTSFLIMPVQRLPRYRLLLQDIFKETANGTAAKSKQHKEHVASRPVVKRRSSDSNRNESKKQTIYSPQATTSFAKNKYEQRIDNAMENILRYKKESEEERKVQSDNELLSLDQSRKAAPKKDEPRVEMKLKITSTPQRREGERKVDDDDDNDYPSSGNESSLEVELWRRQKNESHRVLMKMKRKRMEKRRGRGKAFTDERWIANIMSLRNLQQQLLNEDKFMWEQWVARKSMCEFKILPVDEKNNSKAGPLSSNTSKNVLEEPHLTLSGAYNADAKGMKISATSPVHGDAVPHQSEIVGRDFLQTRVERIPARPNDAPLAAPQLGEILKRQTEDAHSPLLNGIVTKTSDTNFGLKKSGSTSLNDAFSMRLQMSYKDIVPNLRLRAAFAAAFQRDIANALKIPPHRVDIKQLSEGSIIVDFRVKEDGKSGAALGDDASTSNDVGVLSHKLKALKEQNMRTKERLRKVKSIARRRKQAASGADAKAEEFEKLKNTVKLLEGKIARGTDLTRSPEERIQILLGESSSSDLSLDNSSGNSSAESVSGIQKRSEEVKVSIEAGKSLLSEGESALRPLIAKRTDTKKGMQDRTTRLTHELAKAKTELDEKFLSASAKDGAAEDQDVSSESELEEYYQIYQDLSQTLQETQDELLNADKKRLKLLTERQMKLGEELFDQRTKHPASTTENRTGLEVKQLQFNILDERRKLMLDKVIERNWKEVQATSLKGSSNQQRTIALSEVMQARQLLQDFFDKSAVTNEQYRSKLKGLKAISEKTTRIRYQFAAEVHRLRLAELANHFRHQVNVGKSLRHVERAQAHIQKHQNEMKKSRMNIEHSLELSWQPRVHEEAAKWSSALQALREDSATQIENAQNVTGEQFAAKVEPLIAAREIAKKEDAQRIKVLKDELAGLKKSKKELEPLIKKCKLDIAKFKADLDEEAKVAAEAEKPHSETLIQLREAVRRQWFDIQLPTQAIKDFMEETVASVKMNTKMIDFIENYKFE